MNVFGSISALPPRPRAAALGSFDGVHAGHRAVIAGLQGGERTPTVVTFRPHLQTLVGRWEPRLATVERRLELLSDAGVEDVVLIETAAQLEELSGPGALAAALRSAGVEVVCGGPARHPEPLLVDLDDLERRGLEVRCVAAMGLWSSEIRQLVVDGNLPAAGRALGAPFELEGVVVRGRGRAGTIGFPTANIELAPGLVCPPGGVYAGAVLGHRAGISVGIDHAGAEPRVEAHLLDFSGDLYGQRLLIEVWQRLRGERHYASEDALLAQTAADLARAREAVRPA